MSARRYIIRVFVYSICTSLSQKGSGHIVMFFYVYHLPKSNLPQIAYVKPHGSCT